MPPPVSEPLAVPRWVRAVDIVCLLLVVLAGIVAMSGGFRLHIGAWQIAVTSPYPLLLWALAIGVVRHFSTTTAPVYRDLPGWEEELTGARSLAELPPRARAYVELISEWLDVPVTLIGTGQGRHEVIDQVEI